MLQQLMTGLDLQKPDWWIEYADVRDLQECVRECTDGHSGTVRARDRLRQRTATRLCMPIRGAVEAGIVVAHADNYKPE